MRPSIYIFVSSVLLFVGLADDAECRARLAQGTPTAYKVTVRRVEASQNGGSTYITLKQQDMTFDIASVNAGAAAGSYIGGANIPDGTYTNIRATVSQTFGLRGSVVSGGTTYYTRNGAAGNMTITASQENEASINADADITNTQAVNIIVKKDLPSKVKISFDVANTLELWDDDDNGSADGLYPSAPSVTITSV